MIPARTSPSRRGKRGRAACGNQNALDANNRRGWPLADDNHVVRTAGPQNLLGGIDSGAQIVDLVLLTHQARKLAIVRGHNKRRLATIHVGGLLNAIDCDARKAVEGVGIEHQRNIEFKQAGHNLHGSPRLSSYQDRHSTQSYFFAKVAHDGAGSRAQTHRENRTE